jgi:hypothetical protein
MGRIWEDQNKYQRWLDASSLRSGDSCVQGGIVPKAAAAEIKAKARLLGGSRINEIELETRHDVIAFHNVGGGIRVTGRPLLSLWTDVFRRARHATAQVRDASGNHQQGLTRLRGPEQTGSRIQTTIAVGRTHGIHGNRQPSD